jgi:redox-sensing transcriptional repressor
MDGQQIPDETIDRLFSYLRPLMCLRREGTDTVLSRDLARLCSVAPTVLRKDFSYLGRLGTRGVGYNVDELIRGIRRKLRFDDETRVALVGVGNIGRALLEQSRFELEGFRIVFAFDNDKEKIGRTMGKVVIDDAAMLEEKLRAESIQVAILAVPEASAPAVARLLASAGVKSILSFAPCGMAMPEGVKMTCVDLSLTMARLVYRSCIEDEQNVGERKGE